MKIWRKDRNATPKSGLCFDFQMKTWDFTGLEPNFWTKFLELYIFRNIFTRPHTISHQIAALEEDLDKSPDKKPAINKLIDRAIPK